jgi:hypothetical protein
MIASTQAAYSLADTDAGRIADVLMRGSTSSNSSLAEMVAAVTLLRPLRAHPVWGLKRPPRCLAFWRKKNERCRRRGCAQRDVAPRSDSGCHKSCGGAGFAAGDGSLDEKRQQLQGAKGSTALAASVQTDNLDGDINRFQAAWNGLKIDVFDQADGALRNLITTATGWLGTASFG